MVFTETASDQHDYDESSTEEQHSQTWSGILSTGQSLAIGFDAPLPCSTAPVPGALKLHDPSEQYDLKQPDAPYLTLAPLQEPFRPTGSDTYPRNIEGKTPHSAFVRQLHFLLHPEKYCRSTGLSDERLQELRRRYATTVHTAVGKNGALMAEIRKDGSSNSYTASTYEARALTRLAAQEHAKLAYDVILFTHGESDAVNPNNEYEEEILRMQADYAKDLAEITGCSSEPLMILSQQSTSPPWRDSLSEQVDVMWRVQKNSGGKVVCSGPKYQYGYAPGGLHLDVPGYDRLGEKYAEVFWRCLVARKQGKEDGFVPLRPRRVNMLSGKEISVQFSVPTPPLTWDEFLPTPHEKHHLAWKNARGFEVRNAAQEEVGIKEVAIMDDGESVVIALEEDQNSVQTVSYAMTQDAHGFPEGFAGGTDRGKMGHLRDSSEMESSSAQLLLCQVENGSREMLRCRSNWDGVAQFDLVEPYSNAIVGFDERCPPRAYLGKPWTGPSGTQELSISHNLMNYCVSFIMKTSRNDLRN